MKHTFLLFSDKSAYRQMDISQAHTITRIFAKPTAYSSTKHAKFCFACLLWLLPSLSLAQSFDLNITPQPIGGTVTFNSHVCGTNADGIVQSDCSDTFTGGSMVTLTVTTNILYRFIGWSGCLQRYFYRNHSNRQCR